MSDITYHIKIKKEYASAILEDLQQVDAIQILEEPVPAWQQQESSKRLNEMKENASKVIEEDDFFSALEENDDEI